MKLINNSTRTALSVLSFSSLMLVSFTLKAEIYKWKDAQGIIQYSDTLPKQSTENAGSKKLRELLYSARLCSSGPNPEKISTEDLKNVAGNSTILNRLGVAVNLKSTTTNNTSATDKVMSAVRALKGNGDKVSTPKPTPKPKPTPTPTPTPATSNMAFMPIVNAAFIPPRNFGSGQLQVGPTSELPTDDSGAYGDHGAFRIECGFAHMLFDDPIVFPGQQGKSHLHTFFGNVNTNYASTTESLRLGGNSTCKGGIMNRSAYWVPAMIDTYTHKPITPSSKRAALIYYKHAKVNVIPRGLKMIAGSMTRTTASTDGNQAFQCNELYASTKNYIPSCASGGLISMQVDFPSCWDGKNLDSPNHKDHMAYAADSYVTNNTCPATHPVRLPQVSIIVYYDVTDTTRGTTWWRLVSDNYDPSTAFAGYSAHADFMMGWDETFHKGIVDNCINKLKDCHAHLLGDGRTFY
jgi:hypothetical protein